MPESHVFWPEYAGKMNGNSRNRSAKPYLEEVYPWFYGLVCNNLK